MGRIKVVELSEAERQALERGYRTGKTHSYRQRCKGVLLKSEKRKSAEVAHQLVLQPQLATLRPPPVMS